MMSRWMLANVGSRFGVGPAIDESFSSQADTQAAPQEEHTGEIESAHHWSPFLNEESTEGGYNGAGPAN
jgi:hypothetical protein